MDDQTETVPVSFEVLGVEPVNGTGRLIGLATVQVELGGVELTLQGVQIYRGPDGRPCVRGPQFRHPTHGRWMPALLLPPELRDAIGTVMLKGLADAESSRQ